MLKAVNNLSLTTQRPKPHISVQAGRLRAALVFVPLFRQMEILLEIGKVEGRYAGRAAHFAGRTNPDPGSSSRDSRGIRGSWTVLADGFGRSDDRLHMNAEPAKDRSFPALSDTSFCGVKPDGATSTNFVLQGPSHYAFTLKGPSEQITL